MYDEDVRRRREHRDRLEVLERIVWEIFIKAGVIEKASAFGRVITPPQDLP
jgi:hypothetical protein